LMAVEYSGMAKTNPLDATAPNNSVSTSPTSGTTSTTAQANELVAAILDYGCGSGSCPATTPGGYTLRMSEPSSTYSTSTADDMIVSATGTQSATWTTSGGGDNGDYYSCIATFRAE
jgi:hypothetical protein